MPSFATSCLGCSPGIWCLCLRTSATELKYPTEMHLPLLPGRQSSERGGTTGTTHNVHQTCTQRAWVTRLKSRHLSTVWRPAPVWTVMERNKHAQWLSSSHLLQLPVLHWDVFCLSKVCLSQLTIRLSPSRLTNSYAYIKLDELNPIWSMPCPLKVNIQGDRPQIQDKIFKDGSGVGIRFYWNFRDFYIYYGAIHVLSPHWKVWERFSLCRKGRNAWLCYFISVAQMSTFKTSMANIFFLH